MNNTILFRFDSVKSPHNEEFHRLFRLKSFDLAKDSKDLFRIQMQDDVARWVREEIGGRMMFIDEINYWTSDNGVNYFSDLSITMLFTSEKEMIMFKLRWL